MSELQEQSQDQARAPVLTEADKRPRDVHLSDGHLFLLLVAVFAVPVLAAIVWGNIVKAPDSAPLTFDRTPLFPGAGLLTGSSTYRYTVAGSPQDVIAFYDRTLSDMGYYLVDATNGLSHQYTRGNDALPRQVESLRTTCTASSGGTDVEISLTISDGR